MKRLFSGFFSLAAGVLLLIQTGEAQLFQQQFTQTFGPLLGTGATPTYLTDANYVSATPSNSQFTHICATGSSTTQYMSMSVEAAGVLAMDRVSAGNGALIRNFPFPGPPTSIRVKFDFDVTSYRRGGGGTTSNYVNFNIGTSFDTAAGRPSGGFAKFGIGWYRSTGVDSFWYVNNINSGTVTGAGHFLGIKTITFAVNGSGGPLTYTSPAGASETLADQTWDLWVGTSKEFDDQAILDNTQNMSAFKIVNGGGSNAITIDNLLIDYLVTTDVNEPTGLPRATRLEQNYPNPFNPSTVIRYELAKESDVRLGIYDLLGREVATLVQNTQPAGRYETAWEGKSNTGVPLSSGVYLCRLQAGSFVTMQKMMLLR